MGKIFLSYLILFGLKNNIMLYNGAGALQFQRTKMYAKFRYLNTLMLILGVFLTGIINYCLETFIFVKLNLQFVTPTIMVFVAGVYGLLVSFIWQKSSNFCYYLYKSSYSYSFDLVYTISVLLMMQVNVPFVNFIFELIAISLVILVMNAIIGFFVRSMNRGYMNVNFRNVASRLFMLAIISILIYYAEMLIV